jgi:hypothetical protein
LPDNKLNLPKGEADIPSISMSEVGTIGLNIIDKEVTEQLRRELRFPEVIHTYKEMLNDPMIHAGVSLIEMMISKIEWSVKAPKDATEEQLKKAKFIEQCMGDMEHTWHDFIREVNSYIGYGFSVQEKVFRRRRKTKGSKYNDGLVGWRKLPIRSQDTISQWEWSKDGRKLTGCYQDLSKINGTASRFSYFFKEKKNLEGILIPKSKFLLFRYNAKRDNPIGNSPLNACYLPYKFRTIVEEQESIGLSRDLTGMPVIGLHPKYMSPDASLEDKAIYEYYQKVVTNIARNEQSGLVYPLMYNDQGKKIIDFELMSAQGGKMYDTNAIVKRWDDKILTALFADILKLGQDSHGSFSLAGAKTSIVATHIEARLKEIAEVINKDLITHTFKNNGWDDEELPEIVYKDLDEEDLDEFSKLVQRVASVGFLPKDQDTVAEVLERAGFDNPERIKKMSKEEFDKLFPEPESRAGDGMKNAGEGTSNKVNGNDNSTSNKENS